MLRFKGNVLTNPRVSKRFRPLVLALLLAFAACGGDEAAGDGEEASQAPRPAVVGPSFPDGPAITDAGLPEKPASPADRIAFFIGLLGGGDQEEVIWATEMLGRAGAAASGPLGERLVRALERNAMLSENILNALTGTVPAGPALPSILSATKHGSGRVRMAAAAALGYVDESSTVPVLLDLATDDSPLVARSALKAIDRRKSAAAGRGLRGRFATTLSPTHRPTAIRVIARSLPEEEAVAFLRPFLGEEDLSLLIPAVHMLRARGKDEGRDVLHARYEKGGLPAPLMDALLQALAELSDDRVLPLLIDGVRDGPLPRRISAAALLSHFSQPASRQTLRLATQDPVPELRREAWHSLWLGGDENVVSGLRLLLRSESAVDRRIAATLLGELEAKEAAADLAGALRHEEDRRVMMDLAHGLAKLGIPDTALEVARAISRESEKLPSLAVLANNLASALLLYEEISDEAREELARISRSKIPSHRLNAIRALARHGRGDACREAILARMADSRPGVREYAARAWLRFPGAGVEPLLGMLETESRPDRARAIADIARRLAHRWEE
ncbi:MAG: HEAT repeat domain-containing protein [Planctomycetota bacterium]